ncbi:VWA domain-containing protein [Photobacterium leiognathi]|uniref:VWA domain-containing protein n=1 Tax=Photobacterium leiognathi TaxID=553611 RepID=UPI002980F567|nr:VWA domain-containing protein [Photobacterium leiognathi]
MISNKLLADSLPLIGAGLGDKLGVKINVGGNQAFTDGRSYIQIPEFDITSKAQKDAVLGYMAHEAAHIKFNSFKGINTNNFNGKPVLHSLWNIIEDLRIENAMIDSMIGTRKWMDQIWINRKADGTRPPVTNEDNPITVLCDYMLFTCRVTYRDQQYLTEYLEAAEEAFIEVLGWKLQMKLDALIHPKLGEIKTSRQAFNLANTIFDLIENHEPDEDEPDSSDEADNSDEADSSDDTSSDDSDTNSSTETDDDGSCSNQTSTSDDSDVTPDSESDTDSQPSSDTAESADPSKHKAAIEQLKSLTSDDDAFDDMSSFIDSLAIMPQTEQTSLNVPTATSVSRHLIDDDSANGLLSRVKGSSNQLTNKMQAVVEEELRTKRRTAKSGKRLNTRVLHRVKSGDQRLFTRKTEKAEIDTIVEISLDNSGSMDGYLINVAKEAQLSLALALEKLNNVSITASAFPLDHSSKGVYELKRESDSVKSLARNLSTLTASGYNTPSGTAMMHSLKTVLASKRDRKVIMMITDGSPDGSEAVPLANLIRKAERSGIIVIGIAVGSIANYKECFYEFFNHAIFIQDIADLKKEMFSVTRKILTES